MKYLAWCGCICVLFFVPVSMAKSVTDKLIVALVDKHLPEVLHVEKNKPWDLGTYDIQVNKMGSAVFTSTLNYLSLTLPIEVVMKGRVNKKLLGQKILINCASTFTTNARLDIEPLITPPKSTANVEISVPIPESFLLCDGLTLPIQPLLQQVVVSEKAEWEQKLQGDIFQLFQQVGI